MLHIWPVPKEGRCAVCFCNNMIYSGIFLFFAPRSKFVKSRCNILPITLAQNQEIFITLYGSSLSVMHFLNCNNIRKVQNMVIFCDDRRMAVYGSEGH